MPETEPPVNDAAAETAYRDAWNAWRKSIGLERDRLEKEMDRLQPRIASGPKDPRWVHFTTTLEGFREFWSGLADHYKEQAYEVLP